MSNLSFTLIQTYPNTLFYALHPNPFGDFVSVHSEDSKLSHLFFNISEFEAFKIKLPHCRLIALNENTSCYQKLQTELTDYFSGQLRSFSIPMILKGTDFQIKAWQALLAIPYGQHCSYQDLAIQINHPKAVRAIGTANGANPIPILIPCHRVIRHNGELGGYGGGLPLKHALLKIENPLYLLPNTANQAKLKP